VDELTRIIGVLFLLLAALIVGSFMMVLADINGVMMSDQVPRETLSISTRIALSVFQDDSMAASDEINFVQMISLANSTFLGYGVATLVCAGYGVFLLLNSRKESTIEGES
jgi:ABC-type Fe3+-siderophore transport system permease subunit